jgi:hypothetical protein
MTPAEQHAAALQRVYGLTPEDLRQDLQAALYAAAEAMPSVRSVTAGRALAVTIAGLARYATLLNLALASEAE